MSADEQALTSPTEMIDGEAPYAGLDREAILFSIHQIGPPNPRRREPLSDTFKKFLSLVLNVDPPRRPSAGRLLEVSSTSD